RLGHTTHGQGDLAAAAWAQRPAADIPEEDVMEQATEVQASPAEVAERIADSHARAVVFPEMEFAESAPVGEVAQRMADGTFDKAFVISEIERFTGVKVSIPNAPGKVLAVIPEHGYWAS